MKRIRCLMLIWVLFGLLLPAFKAQAQEYIAQIEYFDIEKGLSHRQVNVIFQDSKGLIWLGTPNGLNRFDGYHFKHYSKEKDGLSFNYIRNIQEAADGWLWLIDEKGYEICLFNPETGEVRPFKTYFAPINAAFANAKFTSDFYRDNEGALWLPPAHDGLLYRYHPKDGIKAIKVEQFHRFYIKYITPQKTIWGVDEDNIFFEIDQNGKTLQWKKNERNRYVLSATELGLLTSATTEQTKYYDWEGRTLPQPAYFKKNDGIQSQMLFPFDDKGNFVLDNRLIDFYGKTLCTWEYEHHKDISMLWRCALKDRSGQIWMGDDFGLYKLRLKKNRFKRYFFDSVVNLKTSILGIVTAQGKLYANQEKSGLYETDISTGQSRLLTPTNHGWDYFGLIRSKDGHILTGHLNDIIRFTPDLTRTESIRTNFAPWAFCEDRSGRLWIGAYLDGIYCLQPNAKIPEPLRHYNGFDELAAALAVCIKQDKQGIIWACANTGFYKIDPEKGVLARYWNGGKGEFYLPADNFLHFHVDKDNIFWFATANGLVKSPSTMDSNGNLVPHWDETKGRHFNRARGLYNDFVYAVYEDRSNRLWLPTDNGIVCFNKHTETIKSYFVSDGISNNEFNRIAHFQDENGMLYFGGLNGVNAFDPSQFDENSDERPAIPMALMAVNYLDGSTNQLVDRTRNVLSTGVIEVRPEYRFFNIDVSLLSFEDPKLLQYAWKIEGLDADWHYQNERQLNFGGLPYGKYQLRIKGRNADGRWSANELIYPLHILRPWYLQAWFFILTALALFFSIRSYVRYRYRQHLAAQKKLEQLIATATEQIEQDKYIIEKQAEELRHLDKIKSNFFANVSHELRTPLTLLLGPIDTVLKRKKIDNQDFTFIKLAQTHAKQLLKLVNQILELSKLESGKLTLRETPVILYPLIRRVVAAFESHADQRNIQLGLQFLCEKNLRILIDPDKVETILNNLLSNALKFTPSDAGGMVDLVVENLAHSISIKVVDNGRGIHPDDVPNIFNRFYQSEQPNAPTEGGTGIGLALCKELVELMGGKISVESPKMGLGSIFTVEIPHKEILGLADAVEYEVAEAEPLNSIVVPVPTQNKAYKVFVVEDNKSLRDYLQFLLAEQYYVEGATNGKVALNMLADYAESEMPDLIITDIMMPEMDGFQLLESLKLHPAYQQIPVIVLTARADMRDQLHALRIGVDDYLLKPFDQEELLARVSVLLECYRERRSLLPSNTAVAPNGEPEENQAALSAIDQQWLEDLKQLVRSELRNDLLSVTWLAGQLYLSERQLQRRINSLTGFSPVTYLREIRLLEARQLLEQRKVLSVKAAARAVGLNDEKYFSQIFRERFGKSPLDLLN